MTLASAASPCHLLFDLDGTLSDPRQGICRCFNQALTNQGRGPLSSGELTAAIGPPLEESFSRLLATSDVLQISRAVADFRQCYGNGGLFANILHPGIIPLLQGLHERGCRLFVVTAKKEEFARRILDHFHLDIFFTDLIGVSSQQSGDKASLIAAIIARHKLPVATTIMIGDRSHDIIGARAHGLDSYGVLWGFGSQKELIDAGATKIFASPTDLQTFLLAGIDCRSNETGS